MNLQKFFVPLYQQIITIKTNGIMKRTDLEKYFEVNGMAIVSRIDYESLPCAMYAMEFDDEKMQRLAELIYDELSINYHIEDSSLKEYFNGDRDDIEDVEDIDNAFWREMEECAVHLGMRYYEDMSVEEYTEITSRQFNLL